MKSKVVRKIFHGIILLLLIVLLCVCFFCCSDTSSMTIKKELEINISGYSRAVYQKTGAAPFGDGYEYVIFSYGDEAAEKIKNEIIASKHWHSLPMTDKLIAFIYGGYVDGKLKNSIVGEFLVMGEFPEVANGYYFIRDDMTANEYNRDIYIDTNLFEFPYNCTIGVFDADTNTLYYIRYDT